MATATSKFMKKVHDDRFALELRVSMLEEISVLVSIYLYETREGKISGKTYEKINNENHA